MAPLEGINIIAFLNIFELLRHNKARFLRIHYTIYYTIKCVLRMALLIIFLLYKIYPATKNLINCKLAMFNLVLNKEIVS